MLVFRCATHQAHLAVRTAVCGPGVHHSKLDGHPLLVGCIRLFKHLMPEMVEDFSRCLHTYVQRTATFLNSNELREEHIASARRTLDLQRLYGPDVLPDSLVGEEGVNGDLSALQCIRRVAEDDRLSEVFRAVQRHCLQVDEKPVATRFHMSAECVHCLLR